MGRRNKSRVQAIRAGEAPAFRRVAREREYQQARERWEEEVLDRMQKVAPQFPEHLDIVAEVAAEMLEEGPKK
jgi:hypothetical protein